MTDQHHVDHANPSDAGEPEHRLVRPYLITGGRTVVDDDDIQLETLLQRTPPGTSTQRLRFESARIVELSERPIALVEIAARLELPIGVTRVLVSDLARSKALTALRPIAALSNTTHTSLLEKVLDGVRSL